MLTFLSAAGEAAGCKEMGWPQASVWVAALLCVAVVLYAFCRYVLGDG